MQRPGDQKAFAKLSCSVTGSTVEKNRGEMVFVDEQDIVNCVTELEVCPQSPGESFQGFEERMAGWERRRQVR